MPSLVGSIPLEEPQDTPGMRGRLTPLVPRRTARGRATETGLAKFQAQDRVPA